MVYQVPEEVEEGEGGVEEMTNERLLEVLTKQIKSVVAQNAFIRKQLEIMRDESRGGIHIWASKMLEHMDKLK